MGIYLGGKAIKKAFFGTVPLIQIYLGEDPLLEVEQKLIYAGTITPLSVARYYLAATTVGDYAIFGGGHITSDSAVVDVYDASLSRAAPTQLSVVRGALAAATVGGYALFGGGSAADVVDAYTVQ